MPATAPSARPASGAELIRIARTPAGANLLTIRGISPHTSADKLHETFSECGLIDNLSIYRSDDRGADTYALVQYYSAGECLSCLHCNHGRIVDGRRLDVRKTGTLRMTQRPADEAPQLAACKAIDIMNHFVGALRWSHEVLSLERLPLSAVAVINGQPQPEVRAVARVRVTVAGDVAIEREATGSSDGVACRSPGDAGGAAKKAAVTNAVRAALQAL
eukprot:3893560-Prymnesium_polylepis.1